MIKLRIQNKLAFVSKMARYSKIPFEFELKHVVIIHRHGDRSQISRTIGTMYPESSYISSEWTKRLPTDRSCKAMLLAAHPGEALKLQGGSVSIKDTVYGGRDRQNKPYAQLTELGSQQLVSVGKILRQRYADLLPGAINEASSALYCRSTNTCRTEQSLRSLLVGLFDVDPDEYEDEIRPSSLNHLIRIHTRPYELENLYPQGGGPAMVHRRTEVYPSGIEDRLVESYEQHHARAQELFQFEDKVNWVAIMEVLNCHAVHNIKHIRGATQQDLDKSTEISAWHWGLLYKDKILNRLAIGRFLWDIKTNLESAMGLEVSARGNRSLLTRFNCCATDATIDLTGTELAASKDKRMLIYSGHDSTLVPVLCALGIYNEKWPPYAAHLALEVATLKDHPSELFVRAVYNSEEVNIFGYNASTWCPMEVFWKKLQIVACSPEEYRTENTRIGVQDHNKNTETVEDVAFTSKELADKNAAMITGQTTGSPKA